MLIVAVLAVLNRSSIPTEPTELSASVEAVFGTAWSRSVAGSESAEVLHSGHLAAPGSELATGKHGRIAIRTASGHSVRLDHGTRIRILGAAEVALDAGAVYVDSGPRGRAAEGALRVHTSHGIVRDIGTQFEVRLTGDVLRVRVREGMISLDRPGDDVDASAGSELIVVGDGSAQRAAVSSFGPHWDWIREVTPMMRLEGRTAREFLDWIARERGLELNFSSPQLAESAETIVLNGSIEGMSLDQALDAVMPTCRMTHRIEHSTLFVDPVQEVNGSS